MRIIVLAFLLTALSGWKVQGHDANRLQAYYNRLLDGLNSIWSSSDSILKESCWQHQEDWAFSRCLTEACQIHWSTSWNCKCWEWIACFLCCFDPFPGWNWLKMLRFCYDWLHSLMHLGDNQYRRVHAHPDYLWLCHTDWNLHTRLFNNK